MPIEFAAEMDTLKYVLLSPEIYKVIVWVSEKLELKRIFSLRRIPNFRHKNALVRENAFNPTQRNSPLHQLPVQGKNSSLLSEGAFQSRRWISNTSRGSHSTTALSPEPLLPQPRLQAHSLSCSNRASLLHAMFLPRAALNMVIEVCDFFCLSTYITCTDKAEDLSIAQHNLHNFSTSQALQVEDIVLFGLPLAVTCWLWWQEQSYYVFTKINDHVP